MIKLQLLSDLHLEFEAYEPYTSDCDVIILAGDIHTKKHGVKWAMEALSDKPVLYVLGNHEYYGAAYPKLVGELKSLCEGSNVTVLENDHVEIAGINFYGCTLWTDFELFGNARLSGYECQQVMNDFKRIRVSPKYSKLRSIDAAVIHNRSLRWLASELDKKTNTKKVVISHHGPSPKSLPAIYKNDVVSSGYVSNLEGFIQKHQPNLWLHGHMHNSSDYVVDSCRVVCNPRGYPGERNPNFEDQYIIEIEEA